ncbi:MAG TPA: DUF4019 domain-containing protein [Gemmatimonadales bacterium]|nr:DUF4019 domain-containing protein [Gemmatimonadales bacterium]
MQTRRSPLLVGVALTLAAPAVLPAQKTSVDSTVGGKIQAATKAATRWLTLVDSTRYAASWDSSAAMLRSQVTKSAWQEAAVGARSGVDPLGAREQLSAQYTRQLPNAPPGEYVVLQFRSAGRNQTRWTETVSLTLERDGAWRVAGYYIRPT